MRQPPRVETDHKIMETKISLLSDEPVKSPVLLMAYNRPDHTARTWAALRAARPSRLWLSQDGPKPGNASDRERCLQVREIFDSVDWPCEVHHFYRDENVGCGKAVSSAIEWFLDEAREGIILEDDILPSPTFFRFCEEALKFHRDDASIASISGFTCLPPRIQETLSKSSEGEPILNSYLSKYFSMWGWATWRDRWEGYVLKPDNELLARFRGLIPQVSNNALQEISHTKTLESLHSVDTWDFQFEFHSWLHGRRHLVPTSSLTSNIGFDAEATHTKHESVFSDTAATSHDNVELHRSPIHESDLDDLCHNIRVHDSRIIELLIEENDMLRETCEERLELIERLHSEANRKQSPKKKRSRTASQKRGKRRGPPSFANRLRQFFRR